MNQNFYSNQMQQQTIIEPENKPSSNKNNKNKKEGLKYLLVIPILIATIILGYNLSNKAGEKFDQKRKDIINNKIEEKIKESITGDFIVQKDHNPHGEPLKYNFNNKEYINDSRECNRIGTTAADCSFTIKKEKGTYTFEEFFYLKDDDIKISNVPYSYNEKVYSLTTEVNGKNDKTYKIDYRLDYPANEQHLLIYIDNKIIKRIDFRFLKGKTVYMTITNNSIILKSDDEVQIYVDIDTDNDKKGHSKLFNLELNNNTVEIKVDENNKYSIKENNKSKTLPLTYRVKFIENNSIDVDVEEGNKLPKPESREGYYWACKEANKEEKEWNFDTDVVTADLFCREYKKN